MKLTVKGVDDKLLIKTPEATPDEIINLIKDYLKQNASFLQGAKIVLDLGPNRIKSADLFTIKNIFIDQQLAIYRIQAEDEQTRNASELLGITTGIDRKPPVTTDPDWMVNQPTEQSVYFNRTVRSGNVVNSAGHLTILGDVNPGAVVTAVGDILIWGKLRGEARAGVNGDKTRIICSLEMAPAKLVIADIQWQANRKSKGKQPEFAQIMNNEIKILSWN